MNHTEKFNEYTIYLTYYCTLLFMMPSIQLSTRDNLGWIMIFVACFNVFVNLSLAVYLALVPIFNNCLKSYRKNHERRGQELGLRKEQWKVT